VDGEVPDHGDADPGNAEGLQQLRDRLGAKAVVGAGLGALDQRDVVRRRALLATL
jgi:hypothetical protein